MQMRYIGQISTFTRENGEPYTEKIIDAVPRKVYSTDKSPTARIDELRKKHPEWKNRTMGYTFDGKFNWIFVESR